MKSHSTNKLHNIKRIAVVGRPGSGKSTFALKLSEQTHLPVYHLDKIFFIDNWVTRNKEEFLNLKQIWVNQDKWIIDGNAITSLPIRYEKADAVVLFLLPRWKCLWRIFKRCLIPRNPKIDDRAQNCPEKVSWKLLTYTWKFKNRIQPIISELQQKHPTTELFLVKSDTDAKNLLKNL